MRSKLFALVIIGLMTAGQAFALGYIDNSDGTVTDVVTGLVWQKSDDDTTRTWQDALTYCNDLNLGGSSNWRLPNNKELFSIVDQSTYDPAIHVATFPGVASGAGTSYYWTSTSYAANPVHAWYVTFYLGTTNYFTKTSSYLVRCVR